jgi:hypothetical protein
MVFVLSELPLVRYVESENLKLRLRQERTCRWGAGTYESSEGAARGVDDRLVFEGPYYVI